jgi:hypothetical protein
MQPLSLLAVDKAAYNEGLHSFQVGVSVTGFGVLIAGLSIYFSGKHLAVGLILCMVGTAIMIYPWTAFADIE